MAPPCIGPINSYSTPQKRTFDCLWPPPDVLPHTRNSNERKLQRKIARLPTRFGGLFPDWGDSGSAAPYLCQDLGPRSRLYKRIAVHLWLFRMVLKGFGSQHARQIRGRPPRCSRGGGCVPGSARAKSPRQACAPPPRAASAPNTLTRRPENVRDAPIDALGRAGALAFLCPPRAG